MDKFIYVEKKDKAKFIAEGFKYICDQILSDVNYCVFENNTLKKINFENINIITSNKMYF